MALIPQSRMYEYFVLCVVRSGGRRTESHVFFVFYAPSPSPVLGDGRWVLARYSKSQGEGDWLSSVLQGGYVCTYV